MKFTNFSKNLSLRYNRKFFLIWLNKFSLNYLKGPDIAHGIKKRFRFLKKFYFWKIQILEFGYPMLPPGYPLVPSKNFTNKQNH